jgi:hypothetical protein
LSNIGLVQSPEERISSTIRFHFAHDLLEEGCGGSAYLSLNKHVVKFLFGVREGKLRPLAHGKLKPLNDGNPSVIQGGPEVVNSLPGNESDFC